MKVMDHKRLCIIGYVYMQSITLINQIISNNQVVHSHINTNNSFEKIEYAHIWVFKSPNITYGLLF